MAGGSRSADVVVHVQTGSNDGRVADPPHDLEVVPHRARHPGDVAVPVQREDVDGAATLRLIGIYGREVVVPITQCLFPVEPVLACLVGQQILLLEPVHLRELQGAPACQQPVIGAFHHEAGHRARSLDVLQCRHSADVVAIGTIHHRCVELKKAILVRVTPVPHRPVPGVELGDVGGLLGRVHGGASILQHRPGSAGHLFTHQGVGLAGHDERAIGRDSGGHGSVPGLDVQQRKGQPASNESRDEASAIGIPVSHLGPPPIGSGGSWSGGHPGRPSDLPRMLHPAPKAGGSRPRPTPGPAW